MSHIQHYLSNLTLYDHKTYLTTWSKRKIKQNHIKCELERLQIGLLKARNKKYGACHWAMHLLPRHVIKQNKAKQKPEGEIQREREIRKQRLEVSTVANWRRSIVALPTASKKKWKKRKCVNSQSRWCPPIQWRSRKRRENKKSQKNTKHKKGKWYHMITRENRR